MQDAYELKQAIIAKLESDGADNAEEKLTSLYNELAEKNPIFKFNKQVAYYKLAQQLKAKVDTHNSAVKNTSHSINILNVNTVSVTIHRLAYQNILKIFYINVDFFIRMK